MTWRSMRCRCFTLPLSTAAACRVSTSARPTSCWTARTQHRFGHGRAGEGHEVVLPADGVDRPAPAPGLRPPRPVVAAERLLRRVYHAGRGHQGTKRSAAEHGAVQL